MKKAGKLLKQLLAMMLLFSAALYANTEPIWVPSDIDTDLLLSEVNDYNNMSDTQLRSLLNTLGNDDQTNIDMVFITYNYALLYQATKNIEYARKATVLLDRYAEVFPDWPLDYSDNKGHSMWWEDWYHRDIGKVAKFLAQAFDMTRYSDVYSSFSSGTETKIYDFLKHVVKVDLGYRLYMFNAAGSRPMGLIIFGRILEDPELVHLGYWYYNKMLHECFGPDGYWYEAVYGYMTTVIRDLEEEEYKHYLDGYSDPAGFSHVPFDEKFDTPRIDNLNYDATYADLLERTNFVLWETALPDHTWPVMNETMSFPDGYNNVNPRDAKEQLAESFLMNGVGHAALAYGSGADQTQVRFDFSHTIAHRHEDVLHLIYYDKRQQVIGGTGYSYMDRDWNANTINQNLVVVNGQQQKSDYWTSETMSPYVPDQGRIAGLPTERPYPLTTTVMHNNVLLYEPGYQGNNKVQVTEVDGLNAYDNVASRYQRMLALVNIDGQDNYLIDFFRVKGGTQYDWNLHGGHISDYLDHPEYSASTSLNMSSTSGTFGLINFQSSATTSDNWYGEFNYNGVINRFRMAGRPNTTVYKGRAPQSIKNATSDQDYIVARRQASTSDEEHYLVVHETYKGSFRVQSIKELSFAGGPGTAVGLKITLDNNVIDYVIHTLDEGPNYPTHTVEGISNFSIEGRFAHIRTTNGKVTWMRLSDGGSVSFNNSTMAAIDGDYTYRGKVNYVNRIKNGDSDNSFLVDANLPSSGELAGKHVIVTWGNGWKWAYKIQATSGNKIVLDGEPGFNYNGGDVEMMFFPEGTWPGPVSFSIPGTAIMDSDGYINSTKSSQTLADESSPFIYSTNPINGELDVLYSEPINIAFNEKMDQSSVLSAFSIQPAADVSLSWDNDILVVTPTSELAASTTYTITIGSTAQDISGNYIDGNRDGIPGDAFESSFTTSSPPEPFYLYVEAETATVSAPMVVGNDPLASGGQYIGVPEGTGNNEGYATLTVEVPYTDTYYIWGLVYAPTPSDDSYYLSINNDYDRLWDVLYEGQIAEWTWDQIAERGTGTYDLPEFDPAQFALEAGTNTLTFKCREDGALLDKLLITNMTSLNPASLTTEQLTYSLPIGYSTISIPLKNESINTASDLATVIETQLGENTVNGFSYWNTATQRYVSYAPHLPSFLQGTNFEIECGMSVLANTTVGGDWILEGVLEDVSYSLIPGYNLISLELDKENITNASELAAAIEAQLGENSVNGLSYWDASKQQWVSYAPHLPSFLQGTNFATSPGQAYLVNVVVSGEF